MEKLSNNSETAPRTDEQLVEFIVSSLEKMPYIADANERALISLDIKNAAEELDNRFPTLETISE